MKLLIDIGNSTVVVATIIANGDIDKTWRFKTIKEETAKFFRHELWAGFKKYGMPISDIHSVTISSVVPEVNDDMAQAISDLTGITPHFFSTDDALRTIKVDVESPSQLGKDRLADAIGTLVTYGAPAIIFDFGTATTVGVLNAEGTFVGGMIIPGVKTSINALSNKASQLPTIDLDVPRNIVGRNTLECMQSGIIHGTAAMIDGIIDRIIENKTLLRACSPEHQLERKNLDLETTKIIATGGMSNIIIPYCTHDIIIDKTLQFKGIIASLKSKQYQLHIS